MHFESVTAHAFGPFRNQTLKLAPGMNVVHGANESGKSSWQAALQAALCGVKHPKGAQSKQMRDFERRRRPWRGTDAWDVAVVIALADGRRIELRQDLAAKSGSACDADIATRDYSAEIDADGMPDGSRWLGLHRVSFPNTACVRQVEMLAVRAGATDLQSVLQRAADKADIEQDMARMLQSTLREWLPRVTAGRYTECRVDPQTLAVEVRDARGGWQDADLLSHGTTEQIYLLLRLALCRHLVAKGESCPMILDDPVNACDSMRRQSTLETLLAISASSQVIVFTHDDDVLDWGHRCLSGDRNTVLQLTNPDAREPPSERLGTRIANRFRGGQLEAPFDELRGATVQPLEAS